MLFRHEWPGNVRELENAIERSVILSRNDLITPEHLPVAIKELDPGSQYSDTELLEGRSIKDVEKQMIFQTLQEMDGNRTKSAEILGISRRTLQLKLKQYDLLEKNQ